MVARRRVDDTGPICKSSLPPRCSPQPIRDIPMNDDRSSGSFFSVSKKATKHNTLHPPVPYHKYLCPIRGLKYLVVPLTFTHGCTYLADRCDGGGLAFYPGDRLNSSTESSVRVCGENSRFSPPVTLLLDSLQAVLEYRSVMGARTRRLG